MVGFKKRASFQCDEAGAVAIEFAMLGPILIVMLLGIVCYGGYFWIAHSVQQLANDGARAAVAGLDDAERNSLAQASVSAGAGGYAYLKPSAAAVTVARQNQDISINVVYDASSSPFWGMAGLVPMPPSKIERRAVVRLGGY